MHFWNVVLSFDVYLLYFWVLYFIRNWDSAVGIVAGYGLEGQEVGVQVLVRVIFSSSPWHSYRF
jgi:hypothetical protein